MDTLHAARALLDNARDLQRAARRATVEHAEALLNDARAAIERNSDEVVEQLRNEIGRYDGLPCKVDVLGIIGTAHQEAMHCSILAWLLDPAGSHQLSDEVVRWLLFQLDTSRTDALARHDGELPVIVVQECPLERGFVDLVLVLPGLVVSTEVKVWATEHQIAWRGRPHWQTAAYRLQLQDRSVRDAALRRVGRGARHLAGTTPNVVSVFVRPAGQPPSKDKSTKDVTWLDVDRAIGSALRRCQPPSDATCLISAFRTNLLERSGAVEPPMQSIRHARRLVDHASVRNQRPYRTWLELSRLSRSLRGEE